MVSLGGTGHPQVHPRTLTRLGEDLKPSAQRRRALPHRTETHAFCSLARIEPYAVIGYLHLDLLLGSPQGNTHVTGAGVTPRVSECLPDYEQQVLAHFLGKLRRDSI
jgi:hypothetical protein